MLVSWNWLRDYVDVPWTPAELAQRLTASGLEVKAVRALSPEFHGVVVGQVEDLRHHPHADHLWIAEVGVDAKSARRVTLVTGATNLAVGDKVPVALPGATLRPLARGTSLPAANGGAPGSTGDDALGLAAPAAPVPDAGVAAGRSPAAETNTLARTPEESWLTIGPHEFDGVISEGMLCSEVELRVGPDGSGIMILPPDVPVGLPAEQALGLPDTILDIDIYANRADLTGMWGIAREVAAAAGVPLRLPSLSQPVANSESSPRSERLAAKPCPQPEPLPLGVDVKVEAPDLCPRYLATLALGVQIRPSPSWLANRLRSVGLRPISNVVDVTNFVMYETGQPLHAFDLRRVGDHTIVVRRAQPGERITTLDGQEHDLTPDMLVIADPQRALALAGIMGGRNSEIEPDTTDVLLEAATFQAATIRRTAIRLGMRTEASARFEKGLDPNLPAAAAARALQLLAQVEIAGAKIPAGWVDRYAEPRHPHTIPFRPERINYLLGSEIPSAEMVQILERLGFAVNAQAGTVAVPSFRADVTREADLAEEVARFWGYDRLPQTMPPGPTRPGGESPAARLADDLRVFLAYRGLSEVVTYSFISPRAWDQLALPAGHPWRQAIPIQNPLSDERSVLRTTLLPGLLEVAARNRSRQQEAVWIFEIGRVFAPRALPLTELPREHNHLALLLVGPADEAASAQDWSRRWPPADLFDLKGLLEQVLAHLGVPASFDEFTGEMPLHPGRAARLRAGTADHSPVELGLMGELHPDVQAAWELPARAVVGELDLDALLPLVRPVRRAEPLPRYPAVRRDLALLVPTAVAAQQVEQTIRRAAGELLRTVRLFDLYQGSQVPSGYRSMAYSLEFRADERTLRDEEVEQQVAAVEKALQQLNVQVRR